MLKIFQVLAILCLRSAAAATCSELGTCPDEDYCTSTAVTTTPTQRVRKEIRTLTTDEWGKVVAAIWVLKNTSLADGIATYGAAFKPYNYFVTRHAYGQTDTRGDQAHFSDAFITWHAAFVLEFELALLAVDSEIGALPYWDCTIGSPSIFTDDYFGSVPGTDGTNQVVDGPFAYFPIASSFNVSIYADYFGDLTYNGYAVPSTGFLRKEASAVTNEYMTRYGSAYNEPDGYSSDAFDYCATGNAEGTWTWGEWQACIESTSQTTGDSAAGSMHSGPHATIGGSDGSDGGDFEDVVTSPNDPVFWGHHANMDRNKMWYQLVMSSKAADAWDFTASDSAYDGINLNDVIAATFPFTKGQLGFVDASSSEYDDLVTHADVVCQLAPWNAPYTYDDFTGCDLIGDDPSNGCDYLTTLASQTDSPSTTTTTPIPSTNNRGGR